MLLYQLMPANKPVLMLKTEVSFKAGIRRKQRKAAASTEYLARIIAIN